MHEAVYFRSTQSEGVSPIADSGIEKFVLSRRQSERVPNAWPKFGRTLPPPPK